jgi:hypothetical protein
VLDLELAGGVLVDGQGVDYADRVALAQSLELGDDLAVELGLREAQHDQLNGSNRHRYLSFVSSCRISRRPLRRCHESRSNGGPTHRPVWVKSPSGQR